MTGDSLSNHDEACRSRLQATLQALVRQGQTQQSVAKRLGVPAQYLSDVKAGRRTLTELFARRFADEFDVDYLWLLGQSDSPKRTTAFEGTSRVTATAIPVLSEPVDGDPQQHSSWDGSVVPLCGVAAVKAQAATGPYILRCPSQDYSQRLTIGDLLLVSQARNDGAGVHLLRRRGKILLARR